MSYDNPYRTDEKEYLLCAAIHYQDGKTYDHQPRNIKTGFVVCGRRHHNCILTTHLLSGNRNCDYLSTVQGFLSNKDIFYNRQESWAVALKAGQIGADDNSNTLMSEDLW
jgi:hypothetical protein